MANFVNLFKPTPQTRASFKDADGWLFDWARGGKDPSGQYVTDRTAMGIATYYACKRNISEDIAKLPIRLSRPRKDGGSEAIPVHEVLPVINRSPNPAMSAMAFWETFIGHMLGAHGAFAEIVRDNGGKPVELWPLDPTWVTVLLGSDGSLRFKINPGDGGQAIYMKPESVFHVHGFGYDGVTSYILSQVQRTTLGRVMAINQHAAGFFGNNTILSGILKAPPMMKPEAIKNLAKTFRLRHEGAENAYKTAILTDGVEYTPISIDPEKSQLVEAIYQGVEETCRLFRMPPNKVQHLLHATYSNITEENISYKTDCLQSHSVRLCQEVQRKLVGDDEPDVIAKHDFSMILEANPEAKTKARFNEFQMGMYSPNDLLKMENRTPVNEPGMDDRYILANMIPVGQARTNAAKAQQQPAAEVAEPRFTDAPFIALFADQFRKFTRIEQDNAERALRKPEGRLALTRWITDFYPKHREHVMRSIEPSVAAFLAATGNSLDSSMDVARQIAAQYINESRDRITRHLNAEKTMTADEFTDYMGQAAAQLCKGSTNASA